MTPIIILISKYTTHSFVDRYAIWVTIGLAVLAGAILHKATGGNETAGLLLLGLVLALCTARETYRVAKAPTLRMAEAIQHELKTIPDGTEPIVVPDVDAFLDLVNYGEARIRERLVFPASRALDLRYLGNDWAPLYLRTLRQCTPIRVQETDALLASFPRFLIAAIPGDYFPWWLAKEGYRVTPVRMTAILEAEAPAGLPLGLEKK
jgi:hypothetical protein